MLFYTYNNIGGSSVKIEYRNLYVNVILLLAGTQWKTIFYVVISVEYVKRKE